MDETRHQREGTQRQAHEEWTRDQGQDPKDEAGDGQIPSGLRLGEAHLTHRVILRVSPRGDNDAAKALLPQKVTNGLVSRDLHNS
jgi:hypothetical protein